MRLCAAAMTVAWIIVRHRRAIAQADVRQYLAAALKRPEILAGLAGGYLGMTTLALSMNYIDPGLAFMINESWTVHQAVAATLFMRGSGRYHPTGILHWFLVGAAFTGALICIASQTTVNSAGAFLTSDTLKVVLIAEAGAAGVILQGPIIRWAAASRYRLSPQAASPREAEQLAMTASLAAGLATAGALTAAGAAATRQWAWNGLTGALGTVLAVGLTVEAVGQISQKIGMAYTATMTPLAIVQLAAPASTVLLTVIGASQLENPLQFSAGAALLIGANILISTLTGRTGPRDRMNQKRKRPAQRSRNQADE